MQTKHKMKQQPLPIMHSNFKKKFTSIGKSVSASTVALRVLTKQLHRQMQVTFIKSHHTICKVELLQNTNTHSLSLYKVLSEDHPYPYPTKDEKEQLAYGYQIVTVPFIEL